MRQFSTAFDGAVNFFCRLQAKSQHLCGQNGDRHPMTIMKNAEISWHYSFTIIKARFLPLDLGFWLRLQIMGKADTDSGAGKQGTLSE